MADRNVTVKMSADVGQYKAAMSEAASSGTKFEQSTNRSLESVSVKMGQVGKSMTTKVTLPLIAVGAGAVKLSMDFDQSMSKITALVGIGAGEVDAMKASVMALAGETATAPQELADALFVLTSAGLRGDDALSALEAAAKASAAGLGQTNDIARAVAGAMNAYGPEALDAARATDILTATARAGNFETSQLAGALGRVLPFAKQAGASFEDVGGAVALLTRTNGDAAQSITQVQALMRSVVTPTAEASTILSELGMSAGDVRDSIGQNGLVSTLQMLDDQLGGNREQMGRLLGSSEAASAAFQILDADAATVTDTFGTVTDSVGMTDEAFDVMASGGALAMKQAWVDIQVALVEVGAIIGPVVADIAGVVGDLAQGFGDLSGGAQTAIVVLGGLVAAAGPALVITSKLVTAYVNLNAAMAGTRFAGMGGQVAAAAGPLGVLAVTVGAVAYGFATMGQNQRAAIAGLREITQLNLAGAAADMEALQAAAQGLGDPAAAVAAKLRELALEAPEVSGAIRDAGLSIEELAELMVDGKWTGVTAGFVSYTNAAGDAKVMSDENVDAMRRLDSQARTLGRNYDDMAGVSDEVTSSAEAQADAVDGGTEALEGHEEATAGAREELEEILAAQAEFTAAVLDSIGATFDHERATMRLAEASDDLWDATMENAMAQDEYRLANGLSIASDREKEEAQRNLREAQIDVIEQALATADAYSVETGASVGSAAQVQNQIDALIGLAAKHPELQGEIDATIGKMLEVPGTVDSRHEHDSADANEGIDGTRENLEDLDGDEANTTAKNDNSQANASIADTVAKLISLDGRVATTTIRTRRVTEIITNYQTAGNLYGASTSSTGFYGSSEGRYVPGFMVSSLGEDGPEAVLPLTKPGRMKALLTDPRIAGPVIDAMTSMASKAMPVGAAPAPTQSAGAEFPDPDRWGARAADSFARRLQQNGRVT